MYQPRKITSDLDYQDPDGIKLYTLSYSGDSVAPAPYLERLQQLKADKGIDWQNTAAFAIFHNGAGMNYLILCWWGNDNELFNSVSVQTDSGWLEDPSRYSFCLYDMEIMWAERNAFIETIDTKSPNLTAYRKTKFHQL